MSRVLVDLETGAGLALEDAEAQELQHAAAEKGEPTPPTGRSGNCGSGSSWDTESGRSLCPRCRKDVGEAHFPLLSDEAFEGGFLGELTAREKRDYTSEPSTPLSEPQTHERLVFPAPMPANECGNCGAGAELSWDTESGKTLCPRCHREAGEDLLSDEGDEAFEGGLLDGLTVREKGDHTEPQFHEILVKAGGIGVRPMSPHICVHCGLGGALWDPESGTTLCPRCHREAGEIVFCDDGHSRTNRRKKSRKSGPGTMRYKVYTMPKHQKTHE
ncbi:hypothetical protein Pelo_19177 [Pelomyxa schiedti]|nr:hypothetical protein Pelo_19177 [Pelomyxa schiedti]